MKQKLSQVAAAALVTCSLFVTGETMAMSTSNEDPKDVPAVKTHKLQSFSSRNNDAVKIYPDVLRRAMHVVAKENDGKQIDFFVFDLEGTLKHHYKMKARDHEKITGLERGKYVYRVFAGDEETVSGHFEIR